MKLVLSSVLSCAIALAPACDSDSDGGTPAVEAAPYCSSDFVADVRHGPNAGMHLAGELVLMPKPGGGVTAWLAHEGQSGDEPMEVPATLVDHQLTLSFALDEGTIQGTGAFDGDFDHCPESFEGTLTGPAVGDDGDWLASVCFGFLDVCLQIVKGVAGATCFAGCSYAGYSDATCNQTCGTSN